MPERMTKAAHRAAFSVPDSHAGANPAILRASRRSPDTTGAP